MNKDYWPHRVLFGTRLNGLSYSLFFRFSRKEIGPVDPNEAVSTLEDLLNSEDE